MGFFKFLNRREKEIKETEEVSFKNLDYWIENKNLEVEKDNSIFLKLMENRLSDLINNLKKCIDNIENFNWEKIKEKERVKMIVQENLESYLVRLKKVVYDLENLESFDKMKDELTAVFSDFDKRAGMNYQKASILVGKELEGVNENVGNFFREINKLQNENSELFRNLEIVFNVKEKLGKFRESEKVILEIDEEIKSVEEKITDLREEIKDYEMKIEEIKKSEKYLEELKKKEKLNKLEKNFQNKLNNLKSATDFKELTRVWHKNNLEMKIVKKYNKDFGEMLNKDEEEIFKKLIMSLDNKDLLIDKLAEIKNLKNEMGEIKFEKNLTEDLERKIESLQNEVLRMKSQGMMGEKRVEKLDLTKNSFVEDIKIELMKIDISLTF
tara:strand:+ start:357 stop:1508 length:1152 start_codon:yes stop_codon:yes gene_type:complete